MGLAVVADTVVRLTLLLFSRQENQKEWTKVLASTYRDHIILCGIGFDENVYCWGSTSYAQLGLGVPAGFVTKPTALTFPTTLKFPVQFTPVIKPSP